MYEWNTEYSDEQLEKELYAARFLRVLEVILKSWENDDLDIEDMTLQLEKANDVMEGKIEYKQMIMELGLRDILYS